MLACSVGVVLMTATLVVAVDPDSTYLNVVNPEPYYPPPVPSTTAQYPSGQSACDAAVRVLMDVSDSCLDTYQPSAENQHYCQDEGGCRKSLTKPIQDVSSVCKNAIAMFPTISAVFDRISYSTRVACPETEISCDTQSSLVLAMMELHMNSTANRAQQCTPCVKKSFGRMSVSDSVFSHEEIFGKSQCNKIEGQYCQLESPIVHGNICKPCNLRYIAKRHSVNQLQGVESNLGHLLRACYDNGSGDSCYNQAARVLTESNYVNINQDGTFTNFGNLESCHQEHACTNRSCISALENVIQQAGCCSPALPALLLRNMVLPCLEPLIHTQFGKDVRCYDIATRYVQITVSTTDSAKNVCKAVREDLATTLAIIPDLITCQKLESENNQESDGSLTVRASFGGNRPFGMPETIPFDPDLFQYEVTKVLTMAVL